MTAIACVQTEGRAVTEVEKPNCTWADEGETWTFIPIAPAPRVYVPAGATFQPMLVTRPAAIEVVLVSVGDGVPDPELLVAITWRS